MAPHDLDQPRLAIEHHHADRFVRQGININQYRAASTISGGEVSNLA